MSCKHVKPIELHDQSKRESDVGIVCFLSASARKLSDLVNIDQQSFPLRPKMSSTADGANFGRITEVFPFAFDSENNP